MTDQAILSIQNVNWYLPAQDGYNIPLVENLVSTNGSIQIDVSSYPYIDLSVTGTNVTADKVTITNDDTTNASMYLAWVTGNTGDLPVYVSSSKLSFNPSTATLTTSIFSGDLHGNADSATYSTNAAVTATTTNALFYLPLTTGSATAHYPLYVGSGLTFNPNTNTLATTTFSGALSGTATNADNIKIVDDNTTNATMYPTWVTANTGYLPLKVSSTKISFNPNTATLTTSIFSGSLSGNATSATNLAGGLANQIPYQTAPSTTSFMTAAANSILVTNGSNVPSLSTTIPAGVGFASNVLLPVTTSTVGQIQFASAGGGITNIHTYGNYATAGFKNTNFFAGIGAGNFTNTGYSNYGIGGSCLSSLTTGYLNAGFGLNALNALTTGHYNYAFGLSALALLTTGSGNCAYGEASGSQLVSGNYNSLFGLLSGFNYTGAESSNICISNQGVLGESNVLRLGTTGGGVAQQNQCYIAAIYGTSVGATAGLAIIDSTEKLGSLSGAANTVLVGGAAPSFSATIPSTVLGGSSLYVGTTAIALNRSSAAQSLTGITSIDGYAAQLTDTATTTNASYYLPLITGNTTGQYSQYVGSGLTFNPNTNVLTTTTFSGALSGNATTATTATNATNIGITDDTSTNADMYLVWVTANTGNLLAKVSSTQLKYHPSTGLFTLPKLSATDTTEATTGGAGSIITSGGIYATKAIINGSTTDSSSVTTGALITAGGAAIGKKLYVGTGIYLPTSGGTAAELNFYEENYTFNTNVTGIWAAAQNINVIVTRIGNIVTLQLPTTLATATTSAFITFSSALPTRFRPAVLSIIPIVVRDNTVNKRGSVIIQTNGVLAMGINYYTDVFAGAGSSGFVATSLTYHL